MVPRTERGFTLLEMMLALVLFAGATVAAMELLHRAQASSTEGEFVLLATYQVQLCLENLRNVSYASLTVGSSVMTGTNGCGTSVASLPSGSRSVTITQPYTNLRQVAVTVSWTAPGGTPNVVLQTYRSSI